MKKLENRLAVCWRTEHSVGPLIKRTNNNREPRLIETQLQINEYWPRARERNPLKHLQPMERFKEVETYKE